MSVTPAQWAERFAELSARKTRAAETARLWPYETEFVAEGEDAVAIGTAWTEAMFGGAFYLVPSRDRGRPACSLVFVQSADGNTGAADPSALGGGDTDTHLIYEGLSRAAADAVLAGAETAREGDIVFSVWHPELVALRAAMGLRRHPAQIIATRRGVAIETMLLCNVPEIPVIVITGRDAPARMRRAAEARPWISLLTIADPRELPRAFSELAARGIARVSCIGGRTLASQLLEHRLVDDVFLTTSPRVGGEPGTPIGAAGWRDRVILRKRGSGDEVGVVFEHLLPAP